MAKRLGYKLGIHHHHILLSPKVKVPFQCQGQGQLSFITASPSFRTSSQQGQRQGSGYDLHRKVFPSSSTSSIPLSWNGSQYKPFSVQTPLPKGPTKGQRQPQWDSSEEDPEPEGDAPYIVYDGALKRQLKHIKIFSLATTMGGLPLQPVIYSHAPEHGMAATIAMLSMVGFFTYVTPFLIHQLAKKYVTEIIYDPMTQNYTAVTYNFFLLRKELTFSKEDVIVPDVPGPFTSVLVNGKDGRKTALFFAMESFIYSKHYGLIMGYDKPLDFDLHIKPEDITAAVDNKKRKENR